MAHCLFSLEAQESQSSTSLCSLMAPVSLSSHLHPLLEAQLSLFSQLRTSFCCRCLSRANALHSSSQLLLNQGSLHLLTLLCLSQGSPHLLALCLLALFLFLLGALVSLTSRLSLLWIPKSLSNHLFRLEALESRASCLSLLGTQRSRFSHP